jgi:hypothetical protein
VFCLVIVCYVFCLVIVCYVFRCVPNLPQVAQPVVPIILSAALVPNKFGYIIHQATVRQLWDTLTPDGVRIRDVVAQWNLPQLHADDEELRSVVQLWAPIVVLISHAQWHWFGIPFNAMFTRGCAASALKGNVLPAAHQLDGDVILPNVVPNDDAWGVEGINEVAMRSLGDQVREWADMMLNGRPIDQDTQLALFETTIAWLDRQCDLLKPTTRESFGHGGFQRRYKLDFMLQVFFYGNFFRSSTTMKDAIIKSLNLMLSPALAQHYRELMNDSDLHIPSASARSRFRFILDCAFMLSRREFFHDKLSEWEEGPAPLALFMYTDSSPQGGMNWQITSYDLVRVTDLVVIAEALEFLVRKRVQHDAGHEDTPDELLRERELILMLHVKIERQYCIPCGLGSKRTALGNKLHACYHGLFMDGGESIGKITQCVFSITSDYGVEAGFTHALPTLASTYFPFFSA